jgi:hypothetical protein
LYSELLFYYHDVSFLIFLAWGFHVFNISGTTGILQRQGLGSRSPQDDATDILDSSPRGEDTSDTPSSKLHGLGSDGTFISKSKPKKKKMKSYSGLPGLRSSEGGISGGTPGKVIYICILSEYQT